MRDKSTYCDMTPFLTEHAHEIDVGLQGPTEGHIRVVGGPQVTMVCMVCGICQTIDQIHAGNVVVIE